MKPVTLESPSGACHRLLREASRLAVVHRERIGQWSSRVVDAAESWERFDGPDEALGACLDMLGGAWGLNALPEDVQRWHDEADDLVG
jgi:hypothetical protein